ncbi:hypothetical protein SRHO_G00276470 [Serrasalmus rhombeus]
MSAYREPVTPSLGTVIDTQTHPLCPHLLWRGLIQRGYLIKHHTVGCYSKSEASIVHTQGQTPVNLHACVSIPPNYLAFKSNLKENRGNVAGTPYPVQGRLANKGNEQDFGEGEGIGPVESEP